LIQAVALFIYVFECRSILMMQLSSWSLITETVLTTYQA